MSIERLSKSIFYLVRLFELFIFIHQNSINILSLSSLIFVGACFRALFKPAGLAKMDELDLEEAETWHTMRTCDIGVSKGARDACIYVYFPLPPRNRTWIPKMAIFKRSHIFQTIILIILGIHVSFWGCIFLLNEELFGTPESSKSHCSW